MTGSDVNFEPSLWLPPGGWIGRGMMLKFRYEVMVARTEDRGDRARVGGRAGRDTGKVGLA